MEKVFKSIQEYLNAGRKVDRKWGHSPALLINVEFANRETMKKLKILIRNAGFQLSSTSGIY